MPATSETYEWIWCQQLESDRGCRYPAACGVSSKSKLEVSAPTTEMKLVGVLGAATEGTGLNKMSERLSNSS